MKMMEMFKLIKLMKINEMIDENYGDIQVGEDDGKYVHNKNDEDEGID